MISYYFSVFIPRIKKIQIFLIWIEFFHLFGTNKNRNKVLHQFTFQYVRIWLQILVFWLKWFNIWLSIDDVIERHTIFLGSAIRRGLDKCIPKNINLTKMVTFQKIMSEKQNVSHPFLANILVEVNMLKVGS